MKFRLLATPLLAASLLVSVSARADWNPKAFTDTETLEFLTVDPEEGEHWSTVWLAVINDQVYLRLGNRAAERARKSKRWPYTDLRISGETFANVRLDEAPEMAEAVAAAMAEKYWFDVVASRFEHPLTVRAVIAAVPAPR
jgi:hypothetical protein